MEWQTVTCSSHISGIGYDKVTQTIFIEFKGQHLYAYPDNPEWMFEGLKDAPSKGVYFREVIHGCKHYTKLSTKQHQEVVGARGMQLEFGFTTQETRK